MTTTNYTRATAFAAFQATFKDHAARVQEAWDSATEAFPELHKKPSVVRVSKAILAAQADASESRNRDVLAKLEAGCAALFGSEFLKNSGVGISAIKEAVKILTSSWHSERKAFFRDFESEDKVLPKTDQSDDRRTSLVEQCLIKENTLWFLAGYAQALAVFEGLVSYDKPAERQKMRKRFDDRLRGLQSQIPLILADYQLQQALPGHVRLALELLHANERGLNALFDDLASGALKIDAAERDSKGPGQLGAMPRDVMSRICYVALRTFDTCPREAISHLTTNFEVGDNGWTREQIDAAIDVGIQRILGANRRQESMAKQAEAATMRLWAFGQPQPLPRF